MNKKFLISSIWLCTQTLLAPPPTEIYEINPIASKAFKSDTKNNLSILESKKLLKETDPHKSHKKEVACKCDFCNDIYAKTKLQSLASNLAVKSSKKSWTFMVYIAADNDLRGFAARNIRQMAAVGSNENINILVHLDIKISGNKKVSRLYYIEKNRILHLNMYDENNLPMDSGNPQSLITFCGESIINFPAEHYALILWNHGTGVINPSRGRVVNPSLLFSFNPTTQKLELDRSIGYLDFICDSNADARGVCWDDTTGNYLTNEDLAYALGCIREKYLEGEKFHIIGFDACLMSMVEVHSLMKDHAYIMVSSQEVILGTGWNYLSVLYPFSNGPLNSKEFAYHMVASYDQAYNKITNDYTLSAIKLYRLDQVEESINTVAQLLSGLLKIDRSEKTKQAIIKSRDKRFCTHFDEPTYIDLYHFYQNINKYVCKINSKSNEFKKIQSQLAEEIKKGLEAINKTIIAYSSGKNLSNAHGISIYFPYRQIHSSYRKNNFFNTNNWGKLISENL